MPVAATGKPARVPVCIPYGLNEESKIDRGRIQVLVNSFLDQVGAEQGAWPHPAPIPCEEMLPLLTNTGRVVDSDAPRPGPLD